MLIFTSPDSSKPTFCLLRCHVPNIRRSAQKDALFFIHIDQTHRTMTIHTFIVSHFIIFFNSTACQIIDIFYFSWYNSIIKVFCLTKYIRRCHSKWKFSKQNLCGRREKTLRYTEPQRETNIYSYIISPPLKFILTVNGFK